MEAIKFFVLSLFFSYFGTFGSAQDFSYVDNILKDFSSINDSVSTEVFKTIATGTNGNVHIKKDKLASDIMDVSKSISKELSNFNQSVNNTLNPLNALSNSGIYSAKNSAVHNNSSSKGSNYTLENDHNIIDLLNDKVKGSHQILSDGLYAGNLLKKRVIDPSFVNTSTSSSIIDNVNHFGDMILLRTKNTPVSLLNDLDNNLQNLISLAGPLASNAETALKLIPLGDIIPSELNFLSSNRSASTRFQKATSDENHGSISDSHALENQRNLVSNDKTNANNSNENAFTRTFRTAAENNEENSKDQNNYFIELPDFSSLTLPITNHPIDLSSVQKLVGEKLEQKISSIGKMFPSNFLNEPCPTCSGETPPQTILTSDEAISKPLSESILSIGSKVLPAFAAEIKPSPTLAAEVKPSPTLPVEIKTSSSNVSAAHLVPSKSTSLGDPIVSKPVVASNTSKIPLLSEKKVLSLLIPPGSDVSKLKLGKILPLLKKKKIASSPREVNENDIFYILSESDGNDAASLDDLISLRGVNDILSNQIETLRKNGLINITEKFLAPDSTNKDHDNSNVSERFFPSSEILQNGTTYLSESLYNAIMTPKGTILHLESLPLSVLSLLPQ